MTKYKSTQVVKEARGGMAGVLRPNGAQHLWGWASGLLSMQPEGQLMGGLRAAQELYSGEFSMLEGPLSE